MPDKIEQTERKPIKVAKIVDEFTLIINKGQKDGISTGDRFLIYSIGEEIFDPDTKKSLGELEVVKGTGKVTHIQNNLSTISSDMKTSPHRTIRKNAGVPGFSTWYSSILGGEREIEEILPPNSVPFDKLEVGDLAKKI